MEDLISYVERLIRECEELIEQIYDATLTQHKVKWSRIDRLK
jgi:hypothetical protein